MSTRDSEFKSENERISKYSLPALYTLTLIGHVVSAIFALSYNDLESQSTAADGNTTNYKIRFALQEVKNNGSLGDMKGVFGDLTGFGMLATCDFIVASTMFVHLLRYFALKDSLNYEGTMGKLLSLLHIASYSISHWLALLAFYLVAGYRGNVGAILLFVLVVVSEAIQHMATAPSSNLDPLSKRLLAGFGSAGLIVFAVMIGNTLWTRDDNGLQGGIDAFIFILIAESLKILNEWFTQSQKGPIKGETSSYSRAIDSRHAHMVIDFCIKCILVWHINLTNAINEGDGVLVGSDTDYSTDDLKDHRFVSIIVLLIYAGLVLLYALIGTVSPGTLPKLQAEQSFRDFPSGSLEERKSMLQVA